MSMFNKEIEKMEKLINDKFQPKKPVKRSDHIPNFQTRDIQDDPYNMMADWEEEHRLRQEEMRKEIDEERDKIKKEMDARRAQIQKEQKELRQSISIPSNYITDSWNYSSYKNTVTKMPSMRRNDVKSDQVPRVPRDVSLNKEGDTFILGWSVNTNWGTTKMSHPLPSTFIPTDDNIKKLLEKITHWYDDLIKGISLETLMMEDVL